MEGPEFILFGTTHLAGLAVIFAVMIALPKITNKYFSDKRKLIFKWIAIDSINQKFNFELHRPHLLTAGVGMILNFN